jgi:NAD(P)-dependent dehydrogenase (short-subunit alcohol dehydrogenase family)
MSPGDVIDLAQVASAGAGPRLAGQVALVTGAATGIGAAIARRFRAEGAEVLAAGLQPAELSALSAEIGALAVECDIADEAAVQGAIGRVLDRHGKLDIVVNAAGVMVSDYVETIDDAGWRKMLDVNLGGTMRVCRAAIPALKRSGGGSIVNIASVAAFNSTPSWASYSASKAGVVSLTRSIANQYGPDGIRANCICPGLVRTALTETEVRGMAAARGVGVEEVWDEIASQSSLRRVTLPTDIAGPALFLASPDAALVTGVALVVDGGAKIQPVARAT